MEIDIDLYNLNYRGYDTKRDSLVFGTEDAEVYVTRKRFEEDHKRLVGQIPQIRGKLKEPLVDLLEFRALRQMSAIWHTISDL